MAATPRSLIFDLFGEYFQYARGEVRIADLITLLDGFGVAPATVRVTMSRLRREEWFTTERAGRDAHYRLSDPLRRTLDEGRERIFAPMPDAWDGRWTMVIYQLSEGERQLREELRRALAWSGFGTLTTSTWLAPGDRRDAASALVGDLDPAQVFVMVCESAGLAEDRSLAERCWDLRVLADDYDEFIRDHESLAARAATVRGADALVQRTMLVSRYRHFPFRDPWLAPALLPAQWSGSRAHALFHDIHRALGPAARAYVEDVIGEPVRAPDLTPNPTDLSVDEEEKK